MESLTLKRATFPGQMDLNDLTDMQLLILFRAASRSRNLAMPLPGGLAGAAAKTTIAVMIDRGWLEEVSASTSKNEPLWRETEKGEAITLVATNVGLEAIGIEPVVVSTFHSIRSARSSLKREKGNRKLKVEPKTVSIRKSTKQSQLIKLLQRPEGVTVAEIVEAIGWQAHTARAAISGALKKKKGLPITSRKLEHRGTVYRLELN